MEKQQKCINQTLLIWSGVIIVEIFVIAYLMNFPWLILACFIVYSPVKAALNWPMPKQIVEKPEAAEQREQ